jgi:phage gp36-like protein
VTYAVRSDLETRFGAEEIRQLSDRFETGGGAESVITAALNDANVEIDGYLAGGYTLPLASTPPLLIRVASDIARYRLWKDQASEQVRRGYDDAVDILKRIATGTIKLTVAGVVPDGDGSVQSVERTLAFGSDFESAYL